MSSDDPRFGFDPVAAFLRKPLNEVIGQHTAASQSISTTKLDTTSPSLATLHALAKDFAWPAVLELSTKFLSNQPPANIYLLPHHRLLCTTYHVLALLQTAQSDRAYSILEPLQPLTPQNPKHCYETYPQHYPKQLKGQFLPFELRLLSLEVRIRSADAAAIPDAYALLQECVPNNQSTHSSMCTKQALLLSAIATYHLKAQQHDAAVDIAKMLAKNQQNNPLALYMYARVLLHVGDITSAKKIISLAEKQNVTPNSLIHLHRGLLYSASCQFQEALIEYDTILQSEKADSNKDTQTGQLQSEPSLVSQRNISVFAANNAAISLIHLGRLAEAIERLESSLRRQQEIALDEGIIFNLATLYDLAYPDSSIEKKKVLEQLASRFGRQGFDISKIRQ